MKKILGLLIFAAIFLLIVIPPSPFPNANAAGLVVPKDFPTIQDAINAASDGDTIQVLKGTYTEQLTINKDLKIQGAGAKSTIINAPTTLNNNALGRPYVVDVNSGAKVTMKGFTIKGPDGTSCPRLVGVSVLEDSTLSLDASVIKECVIFGMIVGGGPQIGHATVTKTDIINYRNVGIFAFGDGTTISVTKSNIIAKPTSEVLGPTGIEVLVGAQGNILKSKVSDNICTHPECGPDFFTQTQGSGIFFFEAATGSAISKNEISNNDLGIAVAHNSGCCKISHNKLTDNPVFGMTLIDGEHTSTDDKIKGGNIGVAAVAIDVDTIATLVHDKITGAATPTQELTCCGFSAEIVTIPPNSFHSSQFSSAQTTKVDPDFLMKKFGLAEESKEQSDSATSPF